MSIPILLVSLNYISSDVIGQKTVVCLRVEFQEGESSGTTGNGRFLMNSDTTCGTYIIDPPPHDKSYFQSHLIAVDNYFRNVSYQNFGIDLEQSQIFPETNDQAYTLPNSMDYYNPYGVIDTLKEERLITLFKDAIFVANSVDLIPFEDFDVATSKSTPATNDEASNLDKEETVTLEQKVQVGANFFMDVSEVTVGQFKSS